MSNFEIRKALDQVISAMDPTKNAAASRDMVVVGHSMGGILARLLVSSSGNKLWDPLAAKRDVGADQKNKARERLHGYLFFEPLPSIKRAVFIAAPHRGTPFADNGLARFAAGLVTLPVKLIKGVIQPAVSLLAPEQMHRSAHSFNGIANLSAHDPFIQAAAALPMASGVPFHSIIGNDTPDVPLESSSDGLVPYASAHLEGAASEKVIASGHSVQETPQGILELRRILHEHLHDQPAGKHAAPAGRMSPGRRRHGPGDRACARGCLPPQEGSSGTDQRRNRAASTLPGSFLLCPGRSMTVDYQQALSTASTSSAVIVW